MRSDKVCKYIGTRIKSLRQRQKLTQGMVGKALGISFQQIQKYEKGGDQISAAKLYKLAKLFAVPIEHLFPPEVRSVMFNFPKPYRVGLLNMAKDVTVRFDHTSPPKKPPRPRKS